MRAKCKYCGVEFRSNGENYCPSCWPIARDSKVFDPLTIILIIFLLLALYFWLT